VLAESPNFQWPLIDVLARYFAAVGVELDITRPVSAPDFGEKARSGTFSAYTAAQLATRPMWDFYAWTLVPEGRRSTSTGGAIRCLASSGWRVNGPPIHGLIGWRWVDGR
jgi:hypothetical protein